MIFGNVDVRRWFEESGVTQFAIVFKWLALPRGISFASESKVAMPGTAHAIDEKFDNGYRVL
jgi:hypothetical protein